MVPGIVPFHNQSCSLTPLPTKMATTGNLRLTKDTVKSRFAGLIRLEPNLNAMVIFFLIENVDTRSKDDQFDIDHYRNFM